MVLVMLGILLKSVLGLLAVLVLSVLIYLGLEQVFSRMKVSGKLDEPEEVCIYILSNGVHTDIVVPKENEYMNWTRYVPTQSTKANDSTKVWLALGWGDKGFYLETETWAQLKPRVAINAAFGWSTAAIHATYYSKMSVGDLCREIWISKAQYLKLCSYLKDSFKKNAQGITILVETDKQYGVDDAFFEATGSYSMLHTCNTWANKALAAAELDHCFWNAFYYGIFRWYPR